MYKPLSYKRVAMLYCTIRKEVVVLKRLKNKQEVHNLYRKGNIHIHTYTFSDNPPRCQCTGGKGGPERTQARTRAKIIIAKCKTTPTEKSTRRPWHVATWARVGKPVTDINNPFTLQHCIILVCWSNCWYCFNRHKWSTHGGNQCLLQACCGDV